MSFLGMGIRKSKHTEASPTISLPVSRDVTIVAHIWPSDTVSCKDLRFHFHGKKPALLETDIVIRLLRVYGNSTELNPVTQNIKSIVPNPMIPFLEKKFVELGLNIKWVKIAQ
jgi:hypothetical protein